MLEVKQDNREPCQQGQTSNSADHNKKASQCRLWGPAVVRHAHKLKIIDYATTKPLLCSCSRRITHRLFRSDQTPDVGAGLESRNLDRKLSSSS